ncbi:hypothetical protein, partial [Snodgrassella alvi]
RGWYFNLDNNGERVVTKPIAISYAGTVISRAYNVKKENKLEDPCQETTRKQESDVYSGRIQYNINTGGRLKEGDPHIVFDKNAPLGAAITVQGMYSFTISTNSNPLEIGGNLTQVPLKEEPSNIPEECTRAPVLGVDINSDTISVNTSKIKFRRLS